MGVRGLDQFCNGGTGDGSFCRSIVGPLEMFSGSFVDPLGSFWRSSGNSFGDPFGNWAFSMGLADWAVAGI